MWMTLNISWNVVLELGNDRVIIDKQNSNLFVLFASVRSGLIAFVRGLRSPSFIRLCKVDFTIPNDFAIDWMVVRRRNGICETWFKSSWTVFRLTTFSFFEENSIIDPFSAWSLAQFQICLTVHLKTLKSAATSLMEPLLNSPLELCCNKAWNIS